MRELQQISSGASTLSLAPASVLGVGTASRHPAGDAFRIDLVCTPLTCSLAPHTAWQGEQPSIGRSTLYTSHGQPRHSRTRTAPYTSCGFRLQPYGRGRAPRRGTCGKAVSHPAASRSRDGASAHPVWSRSARTAHPQSFHEPAQSSPSAGRNASDSECGGTTWSSRSVRSCSSSDRQETERPVSSMSGRGIACRVFVYP